MWLYQPLLPAAADIQSSRGYIKVWTGSVWAIKPVKVWTGSVWAIKPVKVWDGSQWIVTNPV